MGFKIRMLDYFLEKDDDTLKELSKRILKERDNGPFGGSGLGIIDIIRASSSRPGYVIIPVDDEKFMFYLNVKVFKVDKHPGFNR